MAETNRHDPIQGEIVHVYDGIEEADNQLPLWWLWTFYLAIGFAVFYWIAYHELDVMPLPMEAYAKELQERSAGGDVSEELLTALVADPDAVGEGRTLFVSNCVVCHADRAEGNIGPNLTDGYWIHGGSPLDIHRTITEGVLDSGMPAWGATLGAPAVQRLAAYVLSLRDTNIPGKEPQGDLWTGGGTGEGADAATLEGEGDEPIEPEHAEDAVDTAEGAGALDEAGAEAALDELEGDEPIAPDDVAEAIGENAEQ
ncbi:MAG: hypothetical protein CMN30_10985 [Sandaracinus sp.]|nr:hypothetical protein [Sandaracinus sp.]